MTTTTHGASLRVTQTGALRVDVSKLAKIAAARIPALIVERCSRGLSTKDKPFAQYSDEWRNTLAAMGQQLDEDLWLTGGLLKSVKHTSTRVLDVDTAMIIIAPDGGTSPQVRPPTKGKRRMQRTGQRARPHNEIGYWLHHGTNQMPARPWLGLSPTDVRKLFALFARSRLTRSAR